MDSTVKRLFLAVSGNNEPEDEGLSAVSLRGVRCVGGCPQVDDEDVPLELIPRLWSDPGAWENLPGRIPEQGDAVVIKSGWNMLMDIDETPDLASLQINGKLTVPPGRSREIRTHSLWVRAGELQVGSEAQRFEHKMYITLLGDNTEAYWAYRTDVEAGNKNFVVTGKVSLWGATRDRSTRLLRTALPTQTELWVEPGLDWQAGEKIAIAATNMRTMDLDHCVIKSYRSSDGALECEDRLEGFHFGDQDSSEAEYGVDMRAEVALLERSIEIRASTDDIGTVLGEVWGCRILVGDFLDVSASTGEFRYRVGSLDMDHVSVYNCSQKHTEKAAIKWEGALRGGSLVQNSVIHNGKGMGIHIKSSGQVVLKDNMVIDFVQHGVRVQNSDRITLDGNWVHGVRPEADVAPVMIAYPEYADGLGAFTLHEGTTKMTVRNNRASGAWHHGFKFRPLRCDEEVVEGQTDFIFENNVAHSISGYGAIAQNVVNRCTEVKDFVAYKCTEAAIMLGGASGINRGRNLRSVDTRYGLAVHSGGGGDAELIDSKVYGELADNYDCPEGGVQPCDHCLARSGLILNLANQGAHADMQVKYRKLPLFGGSGAMTGQATYTRVEFINYTGKTTSCGAAQAAIRVFSNPDYTPYAEFISPTFRNVAQDALVAIPDPSPGWANPSDCVEFTCTGLYNVVIRFQWARYAGDTRPTTPGSFSVISNDNQEPGSTSSSVIPGCRLNDDWNAYLCSEQPRIGVLMFDSLDADRMDRSVQPVWIQADTGHPSCGDEADTCFNNKLNSYMDHCWDGFYACQKRETRFPTMVYQEVNHNIEFTGTPPQKM